MRRRIAVIGSGEVARTVSLSLLARDDCDLTLVGEGDADLIEAAALLGVEPRLTASGAEALAGIDLLVLLEVEAAVAEQVRVGCPDALAYVASDRPAEDCERLQAVLQWPRSRLFGRPAGEAGPSLVAAQVAQVVDLVLADRDRATAVTALGRSPGEHQGWETVQALVGAEGLAGLIAGG